MAHSLTEENYVKIIYKASRTNADASDNEVSTNTLAELTQTKAASVSDMLKKLAQKGLVHYIRYQGVTLTDTGKALALQIIRKHRLWEVFLVEKLHFNWDEVHDIAEQLEHIQSPELIQRLDQFLNFPTFDPHGDPIPNANGEIINKKQIFVHTMQIGDGGNVVGVRETSAPFLRYLDKIGITIGAHITVTDRIEYDESVEICINHDKTAIISNEIARNIYTVG